MLNIAFDETDLIYRQGMETLFNQIHLDGAGEGIEFNSLTIINATVADVVIKSFVPGEEYICQPTLKFRTKPGVIIGLHEGRNIPHPSELPLCITKIIFVRRADSLNNVKDKIIQAWNERNVESSNQSWAKCIECKRRKLTSQQHEIIKYMLNNKDTQNTAELLDISPKTVSTHKRTIMNKFNLKSDCEVLQLFSKHSEQLS
jgi:DNA-binding CsgD family transcriptional regulator